MVDELKLQYFIHIIIIRRPKKLIILVKNLIMNKQKFKVHQITV